MAIKYYNPLSKNVFICFRRSKEVQDFKSSIDCLERLHAVQELVTMCRSFLSSNQECLRSVAQQALDHFKPISDGGEVERFQATRTNKLKLHVQVGGS